VKVFLMTLVIVGLIMTTCHQSMDSFQCLAVFSFEEKFSEVYLTCSATPTPSF
jgi:hypothetical protein